MALPWQECGFPGCPVPLVVSLCCLGCAPNPTWCQHPTGITQLMCRGAHGECHCPAQVKPLTSVRNHLFLTQPKREIRPGHGERMLRDGWVKTRSPNVSTGLPPPRERLSCPHNALTHLRHDGLQLCCRLVKCQSKVVPGLAALLIELAPARTGTSSSHSMCH